MSNKKNWTDEDIQKSEYATELSSQLHGLSCPNCGNRKNAKNGKALGNQRYRCPRCGKHFRSTTGRTIHHLHLKPKLEAYIECMNQGLSLRKTAEKINISLQTAFRWRHRLLAAMRNQPDPDLKQNSVITDYTLPYSSKTNKQSTTKQPKVTSIIQYDATGQAIIKVLGKYGRSACQLITTMPLQMAYLPSRAIPRTLKSGTVKCLTKQQQYAEAEIRSQLTDWLSHFRGVASKYLENYWTWFSHVRRFMNRNSAEHEYMYQCY